MNILVPLNDFEHLSILYEAGAREFYIGFYDEQWIKKYGKYGDLNRLSGFGEAANQYSFYQLIGHLKQLSMKPIFHEIAIYVTFNAASYSASQLEDIRDYFRTFSQYGIRGVIVSNLELTMIAKEEDIESVISTIAGVYNADTVKIYKRYGARRVILPRDLSLSEINEIVQQDPEMEYEVFLMRNGCAFSDSNCLGLHRSEKCSVCGSLGSSAIEYSRSGEFRKDQEFLLNHHMYSHYFHNEACGLCAIYQFLSQNIAAVKIVGRSEDYESICHDIRAVSENIKIAEKCKNELEYLDAMILPEDRERICSMGLSCYYPEVRFPKQM